MIEVNKITDTTVIKMSLQANATIIPINPNSIAIKANIKVKVKPILTMKITLTPHSVPCLG